jgi:cytochrome c-type biogenesis protein CcmH/NrfF
MRPRLVALVVLAAVLALAGALTHRRRLDARRLADQRAAAVRARALTAALDRCLFGDAPVDDRARVARRLRDAHARAR